MKRRPAQAGAFYPGTKELLSAEIEKCFLHKLGPGSVPTPNPAGERRLVGLVCPHAGYTYSGPIAAHSYMALARDGTPSTFVILGPNHWGVGSGVSIMTEGVWQTPLGDTTVDSETAKQITEHSSIVDVDEIAHLKEHSIEVQLPFLQYLYGVGIKMTPISMMMQDLDSCREIGVAIANALKGKNAVVIASSDMTHYEPQKTAEQKDNAAADAIARLDEAALQQTVEAQNMSMCGYGPVSAAIVAAKHLGASSCRILAYKTSGEITGDYGQVVGYLAAAMSK